MKTLVIVAVNALLGAQIPVATSIDQLEVEADRASCTFHGDCAGRRWCHQGSCTRLCDPGEECAPGTSCVEASGTLVCLPEAEVAALRSPPLASLKPAERVKGDQDDMAGVTWFKSINDEERIERRQWTSVSLYFGRFKKTGLGPLRLKAVYHARDWVFAEALLIKVDDAEPFRVVDAAPSRDVSDGIWETLDVALSASDVRRVCSVRSAVRVRFDGRREYDDHVLPENQIVAIQNVCAAWQDAKAREPRKVPQKRPVGKPSSL